MADKRNQLEKIARAQSEKASFEQWARANGIDPDKPPLYARRCACTKPATWAEHDKKGRVTLYCEGCRVKAGLMV